MSERGKLECTECGWFGMEDDVDSVPDPGSDEVWRVCRNCRAPEHFVIVCDEPGCRLPVTCGTPSASGYRQTCGNHRPPVPSP
jgi:hypothetical protein